MKKWIISIYIIPVFAIISATSQNQGPYIQKIEDRIEAQRIAFITERLNLTPHEAQQFWPVYNAYREQEKTLKEEKKPDKVLEDMNEEEASNYISMILDIELKELKLKKEYINDLKNVLPAKKIILLAQAERLFKERLLHYMNQQRNRRQNRPNMGSSNP